VVQAPDEDEGELHKRGGYLVMRTAIFPIALFLLLLPSAVQAATSAQDSSALISQLRSAATPLSGADPTGSLDDLAPLRGIVGNAQIVALGEGSHGTAEFFKMKHRILRYLVEKKGFTVFAIEADWGAALAVDTYIRSGQNSARSALDGLGFWTWDTQEVLDMIEWMRTYNAAPGKHAILSFTGIDMQGPVKALSLLVDYLHAHDPVDMGALQDALACTRPAGQVTAPTPADTACQASFVTLGMTIDNKKEALVAASSARAFLLARHALDIVTQAQAYDAGLITRDFAMAQNVQWLTQSAYPGQRIVVWAHNGHVAADAGTLTYAPMGSYLRQTFGRDYVVIGMTFDSGEIRAVPLKNGAPSFPPIPLSVAPAPAGAGDALFHATGLPLFLLDLDNVPPTSPLGQWLAQDQGIRMFGALYDQAAPGSQEAPMILPRAFNALIYVDVSHPSQALAPFPNARRAAILAFDVPAGSGGKDLGPHWFVGGQGALYEAGADPKTTRMGTPSLYLRSGPDGSVWSGGALSQRLDAAPYLGKRIRVSCILGAGRWREQATRLRHHARPPVDGLG
jgi:erythromycin esterase